MNYTNKKIWTSGELKSKRGVEGNTFNKRLKYQLKTGKFIKLRKALYVLGDQIMNLGEDDFLQIANSIYTPSYISFETSLQMYGIVFQNWQSITIACHYNKEIEIPLLKLTIKFFRVNDFLLSEKLGLTIDNNISLAGPERSICDVIVRSDNYFFDNLDDIDMNLLKNIADIYKLYYRGFAKKFDKIFNHKITLG